MRNVIIKKEKKIKKRFVWGNLTSLLHSLSSRDKLIAVFFNCKMHFSHSICVSIHWWLMTEIWWIIIKNVYITKQTSGKALEVVESVCRLVSPPIQTEISPQLLDGFQLIWHRHWYGPPHKLYCLWWSLSFSSSVIIKSNTVSLIQSNTCTTKDIPISLSCT